jgi:hypothetical protein
MDDSQDDKTIEESGQPDGGVVAVSKTDDGDIDIERQSHVDMLSNVNVPSNKERDWGRVLAIIISLCIIALVSYGTYSLLSGSSPSSHSKSKSKSAASSKSSVSTVQIPTQSYSSSDFNLSLNYPNNWKVVDSGSGPMTVTSPSMVLTSATKKSVTGLITITINKQGQLPSAFTAGTDLAVLNSQLLSYKQPTLDQASQTYLSFVQYSSTTTRGGLDAIYVTGNDGYQKDQVIPNSDIASIGPLITVAFTRCGNSACTTNLTPLTIASSEWNVSYFNKLISTIISSLAFQ